jgi:hypothetical protein
MRLRHKLGLLAIRKKVDSSLEILWNTFIFVSLMDVGTEEYQSRLNGVGYQEVEDLQGSLMDIVTEKSQSKPSGVGS